jgi:nucleoside-diphosphate-sugar epimerase
MTQISLLGCGWLGLPLAKALLKNGFSVKGSTTTESKLSVLKAMGIEPFLINLTPPDNYRDSSKVEGVASGNTIEDFLSGSKTLVIDIPPQLRGKNSEPAAVEQKLFVEKIKNLIPYIEKSTIENVLFVSSTSVYGAANGTITEQTIAKPDTESGKQLLETEALLQNNPNFKTTILRFGGLLGEDRNPLHFLTGKENLENPETPINFIHQEDCIGIILKIIATDSWNEIYNGVCPFHPTRETYYTQKATELALPLPRFDHSKPSFGKLILSDKVANILGYAFIKTKL